MEIFHDFPCYIGFKMHRISYSGYFNWATLGLINAFQRLVKEETLSWKLNSKMHRNWKDWCIFVFNGLCTSTVFLARFWTGIYDRQIYSSQSFICSTHFHVLIESHVLFRALGWIRQFHRKPPSWPKLMAPRSSAAASSQDPAEHEWKKIAWESLVKLGECELESHV